MPFSHIEPLDGEANSMTVGLTALDGRTGNPVPYTSLPPISSRFTMIIENTDPADEDPTNVEQKNRTQRWLESSMTHTRAPYSLTGNLYTSTQSWRGKGRCTVTDRSELFVPEHPDQVDYSEEPEIVTDPDRLFKVLIKKDALNRVKSYMVSCRPTDPTWAVESLGMIQDPEQKDLQVELTLPDDDDDDDHVGTFVNKGEDVSRHLEVTYVSNSAEMLPEYKDQESVVNGELDTIFGTATIKLLMDSNISLQGQVTGW
ncbi:uncharacterized protein I303_108513 [Kwoniella dejecticola CBS 10117]|uniref:Uncharacterized protein n=1 Tax=Kwoniella dejecticola CBS 10117 TaxID=1296121 RepID=A0A1A5ZX73_9TREE|nr:uncharacterized protein I303_07163 [Kwoniella dejecticola CBS 10117]OBR82404.1 hypothetical protein I303_07163 [Kwoniella dejecticola CBS 10117]